MSRVVCVCHQPMVRVWDAQSLVTLAVLTDDLFDGGVCCLAFSYKVKPR